MLMMLVPSTICLAQLRIAGPDSLYFTDGGNPVFLVGDGGWCLFAGLTFTQADTYLSNCHDMGITYTPVHLINKYTTHAPNNAYNVPPFMGAAFTNENEAYFAHVDSIVGLAHHYGVYLLIFPAYLGGNPGEGWSNEVGSSSAATMRNYGLYLGHRYKDSTNVLWGIGGDTDPTPWQAKLDSMVAGIKSYDTDAIMAPRDGPGTFATTNWPNRPWLNFNWFYPYWANFTVNLCYEMAKTARERTPKLPSFLQEAWYEGEHSSTTAQLIQQMYYSVLGGAIAGHTYGNCPIWHFSQWNNSLCGTPAWTNSLNSPGRIAVKWSGKLFRNRHWTTLIPDTSHVVCTSGYGTWGSTTYVTTAYASDSTTIMVYNPGSGEITVTSVQLKGDSTHAWWFNPSNGSTIDLGIQARASHAYSAPSAGWLLVLDAKVMNYPPPGVDLLLAPSPPALVSPDNGAVGVVTDPTLEWDPSTGATSYQVQVSTDSNFGTTVIDHSGITTTSYAVGRLMNSTTYYWRVNATNSAGASSYSSVWRFTTALTTTLQIPVNDRWNLVSVPLRVNDMRTAELFPTSTSRAFGFVSGQGYLRRDTLADGKGYWLKFNGVQNVGMTGLVQTSDTVDVEVGWNIIGSISSPIDTSTIQSIPPGIRISPFYEYSSGYTPAALINPGRGYWVKASAAGRFILTSSTVSGTPPLKLLHRRPLGM